MRWGKIKHLLLVLSGPTQDSLLERSERWVFSAHLLLITSIVLKETGFSVLGSFPLSFGFGEQLFVNPFEPAPPPRKRKCLKEKHFLLSAHPHSCNFLHLLLVPEVVTLWCVVPSTGEVAPAGSLALMPEQSKFPQLLFYDVLMCIFSNKRIVTGQLYFFSAAWEIFPFIVELVLDTYRAV